jgi:hypothetical protein
VWNTVGRSLQSCTDQNKSHRHPHGTSSAKSPSKEKVDSTAGQASEIVAGDDDASLRIGRVVELSEPIFILENASENALVISEEHKSHQAC